MHREHGGLLRSLTCGSSRNTPKILWWKHEQSPTYRKVAKFVTLGGFVTGKLTGLRGQEAFIDSTTLAFFGNEDASRRRWSPELSGAFGLELEKFPRILQPWEVVGSLTREAAIECGLAQGTPLVAGAGDQPAGLLGAGFLHPGDLCDVSGSSTLLIQCVDFFRPDAQSGAVAFMPSVLEDRYHALSYINGGGLTLNWLRDNVLGRSEHGFEELTLRASSLPPGSGGLLFLPYFGGRQCPHRAGFRGGWLGLNWGHRPEHLFRSLLEGLAYDSALGYKHLRELFPEIAAAELNSYGGGSSNALWAQIKANVLGLPVRCLEGYHFAILGCALLAARGVGVLQDLESAARRTPPECSAVFQSAPGPAGLYREYLDIFEDCCFATDQAIPSILERLSQLARE
jgi:xylulokinase